jgi:hypothetical protein
MADTADALGVVAESYLTLSFSRVTTWHFLEIVPDPGNPIYTRTDVRL